MIFNFKNFIFFLLLLNISLEANNLNNNFSSLIEKNKQRKFNEELSKLENEKHEVTKNVKSLLQKHKNIKAINKKIEDFTVKTLFNDKKLILNIYKDKQNMISKVNEIIENNSHYDKLLEELNEKKQYISFIEESLNEIKEENKNLANKISNLENDKTQLKEELYTFTYPNISSKEQILLLLDKSLNKMNDINDPKKELYIKSLQNLIFSIQNSYF